MNLAESYQREEPTGWRKTALASVLPAVFVAYACLLPRELSVTMADIDFRPYRLALLAVMPFVLRQLIKRPIKASIIDLLVVFVVIWYFVSLLVGGSLETAISEGFSQGADFGLAYLTGRVSIRSAQDLKLFFTALLPGLLTIAAILAIESISHRMILRPYLAEILQQPRPDLRNEIRIGLLRAAGPFPHPILGGVFLASLLPIAWYASTSQRNQILGVCAALGCIFTVSSGAVLALVVSFGLMVCGFVQRITKVPVFLVGTLYFVFSGFAISLVSEGGLLSFLIRYLTFDANTGQYRRLIWEYGGAAVMRQPIFGSGTDDWIRPVWMISDSVDAHWLLLSMRHGLPLGITYFLVIAGAVYVLLNGTRTSAWAPKLAAWGLGFSLISLIFSGFTVFLWESVAMWMIMLSGIAVSIGVESKSSADEKAQQAVPLTWQERLLSGQPGVLSKM